MKKRSSRSKSEPEIDAEFDYRPPSEQQAVVVLIVTPIEADKIYTSLGKLPAEAVEELRAKVQSQVGAQRELVKSFYQQPSVQALIAEPK